MDQDEFSEPPVEEGEEGEGSEKGKGAEKVGKEVLAEEVPAEDEEEVVELSVEDELELSAVHELEVIAEEPEPDAPSPLPPPTKAAPPVLTLDLSEATTRPRAAQAGSTTSLAKRSPPLAGSLSIPPAGTMAMPPGLAGLTPKDVRRKFNGHKVVAVLALNVDLIGCVAPLCLRRGELELMWWVRRLAEEFQAQVPIDKVEYKE